MPSPLKKPKAPEPVKVPVPTEQDIKLSKALRTRPAPTPAEDWTPQHDPEVIAAIKRRRRQFLLHSFLYYQLDEPIIADSLYDKICRDLVELQEVHPLAAKEAPYHDLCTQADSAASGFYLKQDDYPPEIISKALHMLAYDTGEPLESVLVRTGYQVLENKTTKNRSA